MDWISPALQLWKHTVLQATIHPDIKRTLVAMSKRTGMTVSKDRGEVLYTGLIEMHEMDAPEQWTVPQKFYKELIKLLSSPS